MSDTWSFDAQAKSFDKRAGLPARCTARVARALEALPGLERSARLLEIGAGTGEIGQHLIARGHQDSALDYWALDASAAMLEGFATRVPPEERQRLRVGDANRPWPVADASLGAVFLSRVAHLLEPNHLWAETRRTAAPHGSWLVFGRRGRERRSLRAVLRRELHRLLSEEGRPFRRATAPDQLISALLTQGGSSAFRRVVDEWSVEHCARSALEAWRAKPGLAGVALDARVKERVLDRLESWAQSHFGDLDTLQPSREHYELSGLLAPPATSR